MGGCFSKRGKASSPTEVASNLPLKNNSTVTEEGKKPEPAEKIPAVTVKKNYNIAEEKDRKEEEIPVKNKGGAKASVTGTGPLRASSCTKEEVDAILIQCGRLSRNSSGKASNETVEPEKLESRPSPSRRTPNRERSGSRERGNSGGRRVSRSPGRRTDGAASPVSTCDKRRQQQPAKMVSVPATEKCAPFGNAEIEGSNKNAQSSYRRDPMAEIDENSLKNQNGGIASMFHRSSELNKGVSKSIQPPNIHKLEKAEEAIDEVENLKQRTVQRTSSRYSRKSSHDFDNNPESNPISYTAFLLESIQKKQNQGQNTVFSFPSSVSKACSVLETVSDHNSSCSKQSNSENSLNGELASRGLLVHRSVIRDEEPRESAGSNSFNGNPLELTSVDSGKEVEVEDKIVPLETHWIKPSSHTDTAVKAATPTRTKKFNHRPLQEARQGVGGGNGEFGRKPNNPSHFRFLPQLADLEG